ncbi:MAG: SpoIIE family protein phosphatase [Caldithrix sp.]|nr:SpoIIE family protein phosphatase [Caldithrix sp.]
MKRINIPKQIIFILIVIFGLITLLYDVLEYYSSISITTWNYIDEALNLLILLLYLLYLKGRPSFFDLNPKHNLKRIVIYLTALYVVIIISKTLLNPVFSPATFPKKPETMAGLIYANIASLSAIFFMLPMLIQVKNLIFHRRKRYTKLYFIILTICMAFMMIITAIFEIPLELDFPGFGSLETTLFMLNSILFGLTLIFLIILSFRNSWITYLSRKDKRNYFLLSPIIVVAIIFLFGYAFKEAIPYHSLVIGVFATVGHWFLVFYSITAGFFLLIQLPTARVFERKMREVSSMHNLSRAISGEFDFQKLVRMVTDMSTEVIEANYTWLEMFKSGNHQSYIAASKNLSQKEVNALNRRDEDSIREHIYTSQKTFLENDVPKSGLFKAIRAWKQDVGSIAGVPLISAEGQVMGILYAAKVETFGFDPDDVNMLEAYASQASIALENANLHKSSLERERLEKELQIARDVQLRLLPQSTPQNEQFEIETLTITAYEVGGDYYDFYQSFDDQIGVMIGDVSGKGTSAAFYMAEAKGIIQSMARHYASPREILIHTNRILYQSIEKKSFISLLALQFDLNQKTIKFSRAGHCPIIHYSKQTDETSLLQPEGIAAGLETGDVFEQMLEENQIPMQTGDLLALYTDGLSEARNASGQEYGEQHLCELLKQNKNSDVKDLKEIIIDDILKFLNGQKLHDDLTLVLLKIK